MSRRVVMIVDDNEHNREYAKQVLEGAWVVQEAADGEAALRAVRVAPPDLMLLDLSMPRLDGWEVLRRLKAEEASARIPVVACTAHAMAGDRERVLAAGFDAYLAKPYRPDDLVSCVESFLGPAEEPGPGWGGDDWCLEDDAWEEGA